VRDALYKFANDKSRAKKDAYVITIEKLDAFENYIRNTCDLYDDGLELR